MEIGLEIMWIGNYVYPQRGLDVTERLLDVYRSPELKYQFWPSLPEILNSNQSRSPDFYGWLVLRPQNLRVQIISLRSFPKILGVHMYCLFYASLSGPWSALDSHSCWVCWVCCSVLQHNAVYRSDPRRVLHVPPADVAMCWSELQIVAACCSDPKRGLHVSLTHDLSSHTHMNCIHTHMYVNTCL